MEPSHATVIFPGPGGTAVGVFSRREGRLVLEDFAMEPPSLSDTTAAGAPDAAKASLVRLRRQVTVRGEVTLVMPPHAMLLKMIKAPPVDPGRREAIVRFEAGQGIPGDPAGIVSDSMEAGACGGGPGVMLAAARLEDAERLCAAAEAADFVPQRLLPGPVGTLAALRHFAPASSRTTLLFDLGIRSSTLLLAEPQGFFARIVPVGMGRRHGDGDNLVSGGSAGADVVDIDANALVARLAQEAARTLLHLSRQGVTMKPGNLVVVGFGADVPGLAHSLGGRLDLPVDRFALHELIGFSPAADRNGGRETLLAFPSLVGSACLQLLTDQPGMNLLPPRRGRELRARRRQPWLVGTGLLVVLALLPPVVHWRAMAAEATRKAALMERALAPVRDREARIRANLRELERAEAQLAGWQDAWDRRGRWREFLADLQDRLIGVGDVWLDRLQLVPAAGSATPKLHVAGRMLDRDAPHGKGGVDTSVRVKALVASMLESPFVRAVDGERFDRSQPGVLSFDFVVVADARLPL